MSQHSESQVAVPLRTANRMQAIVSGLLFFGFWLLVLLAGVDFPPLRGFVFLVALDAVCAWVVYWRVPEYVEWMRTRKPGRHLRVAAEGLLAGLIVALAVMLLPGGSETSVTPRGDRSVDMVCGAGRSRTGQLGGFVRGERTVRAFRQAAPERGMRMNVLLLTVGSRGDIQPYVALGGELVQAGHGVAVCAPEHFRPFIEAHGLAYAHMDEGIMQYIAGDAASEAIGKAGGLTGWIQVARETSAAIKPLYRQVMADAWQAAQTGLDGAAFDAVVYHPKAVAGYHVAEALGVPGILSMPLPGLATTGEFPSIVFPKLGPGWYNRMTYWVANRMGRLSYGGLVNDFRTQTLGLPKWGIGDSELRQVDGSPTPFLHCYSETVSPRPADWPPEWVVSGYWFLDDDDEWEPTAELAAFLDAGAPPVYVGFGSMTGGDPARTTRTVVEGVAMSGQRAVMASGWGGLRAESLPETILPVESVPHGWLFPRVLAVVHHGGAGTTAAGLRAGKPTVICPFFGDQPFWGRRVRALGAGPEPIPQKQLAAEKLAAAIVQAVHDPAMRQNAEQVGWALRGEDGVGNAVQQIEAWAAGG